MDVQIDLEGEAGTRQLGPFEWVQLDGYFLQDEAGDEIAHYNGGDWMTPDGKSWITLTIYTEEAADDWLPAP